MHVGGSAGARPPGWSTIRLVLCIAVQGRVLHTTAAHWRPSACTPAAASAASSGSTCWGVELTAVDVNPCAHYLRAQLRSEEFAKAAFILPDRHSSGENAADMLQDPTVGLV